MITNRRLPVVDKPNPPDMVDILMDAMTEYLCDTCDCPCQEPDTGQCICPIADYDPSNPKCFRSIFFSRVGDLICRFNGEFIDILKEARDW